MKHRLVPTRLGPVIVAADESGALAGLWFAGQRHSPTEEFLGERDDTIAEDAVRQLQEYLDGARRSFDLPLAARGTEFQRRVWTALRGIPFGETTTYGQLARELGSSPRAVGSAVGRNPWTVVVPCHRVVGADGSLVGYAAGIEVKTALLNMERAAGA